MIIKIKSLFSVVFLMSSLFLLAQNQIFKGKIINANNGEAIPYVQVELEFIDGNIQKAETDFEGIYAISYTGIPKMIRLKNDNFQKKQINFNSEIKSEYNFELFPIAKKNEDREKNIDGIVIKKAKKKYANPAYEILEKLIKRKPQNNPEKFESYSYENYSRMEIAMSNFGEKFEKRKVYKDIQKVLETAKEISGTDGKPIIPIFVSENLSDIYYQKNPQQRSEIIKKTRVEGIGIEDGTMYSQLMSSTFIKYNFYLNYIRILGKDFVSPINDNFKLFYDYELMNRNFKIGEDSYYQIKFKPARPSDLAFEGEMLILHGSYALYRIDTKVTENANLNFINNMKIQQEMTKLPEEDNWLPGKTRVFLETAKPGKNSVSVFLKYYASSKNIQFGQKIDSQLFAKEQTILKDAEQNDENYWDENRHGSLTTSEKKMYGMIKEVKDLPSVRSYLDIIDLFMNGYFKMGKVGIGPFLYFAGYNDYEGLRLRTGFKTNKKFSDKWILGGYLSYGLRDEKFKYGANVDYIFSREPWIQGGVSYSHDLGQVAFQYEDFSIRRNNLFDAFTKNGRLKLRRPFWQDTYLAYFQGDILSSLTQKITFKHYNFDPLFPFSYAEEPHGEPLKDFKTSEIISETVWRPGRKVLESNSNKQVSLKNNVYNPMITFRYTKGIKGVFGSDFNYNKFHLNVQQIVPLGMFGRGEYSFTAGYTPNKVPYPILENHLGNQFVFYNRYAFNMMRFFEFTSNKYVSLQYTQHLEGLLMNSIPLINKLNWRNHLTFNYLQGNLDSSFVENTYGKTHFTKSLNWKPYMEVGYGISNIFRFLRVDFVHRLTHLQEHSNRPVAPKFSVKLSAQIRL